MAFNVNYDFDNGAVTGVATNASELRHACRGYSSRTKCVLSGTAEGSLFESAVGTYYGGLFENCSNLISIDISNLDTSNVTGIQQMFSGCTALTEIIGIENLNVSNVTNMATVFYNCTSLTALDLSNWNTSNVTYPYGLFYNASNLEHIYVKNNLDFSKTTISDSTSMFEGCTKLPNYDSTKTNKTMAKLVSEGGYLELAPTPTPTVPEIHIGDTTISAIKLGDTEISKIYLGTEEL